MPAFASQSRNASGSLVERTVEAASQREAIQLLEQDGLFPIDVQPTDAPQERSEPQREQPETRPAPGGTGSGGKRIKGKELLNFSMQLGSSIGAGVPILRALESIARQSTDDNLRFVVGELCRDLEGGATLSGAMRRHPRAFSNTYTSTIEAGEQTGKLAHVLEDLSEFLEAELEVRADVRSAVLYPAIVIATLCIAIGVLIVFVVPRFATFYSGFGSDLPLPTRILMGVTEFVTQRALYLAAMIALAVYGAKQYLATDPGRRALDAVLARTPVLGRLVETSRTLRVTQMLGLFSQSGVPILQGLRTIANAVPSPAVRERLLAVAQDVSTGETLANALEAQECLPPAARQMIAAGEETGSIEGACAAVSRQFKKELAYLTRNLATMIEPLLTVGLATIVLFVALAVFLPMWDLVQVVR